MTSRQDNAQNFAICLALGLEVDLFAFCVHMLLECYSILYILYLYLVTRMTVTNAPLVVAVQRTPG